ncbi:MAG: HD domain-containing protein [Bryobacterales bacterium]|nr:HD domain-containing protein [Bryobacterales bacterium]
MRPLGLACIGLTVLLGLASLAGALTHWKSQDGLRFFVYLGATLVAAGWRIRVPGALGSISLTFVYLLTSLIELSMAEVTAIAALSVVAEYGWDRKPGIRLARAAFDLSCVTIAAVMAWRAIQFDPLADGTFPFALRVLIGGCALFMANVVPQWFIRTWEDQEFPAHGGLSYLWYLPYYLGGAALAGILSEINSYLGWQSTVLIVPALYLVYRYFLHQVEDLRAERDDAEARCRDSADEVAQHLRTIEALAEAIESKDQTSQRQLRRVQIYCREVARELSLPEPERKALLAASMLHDVGKLSVPEHILSKPGRLTREEFAKMKIHPIVGCEILQKVDFPYPVIPIVRHHHEKWDGSGYPDGLKGEEIPIGARILAAVDCLDALVSDRQYRRAFPIDEAMRILIRERGKSFDPRVVLALERRYQEYERLVRESLEERIKLTTELPAENAAAPAHGLDRSWDGAWPSPLPAELTETLGRISAQSKPISLVLHEAEQELRKIVPFDTLALYRVDGAQLTAEYASGKDADLFRSLVIPVGQGLCGWVAERNRPILNGNPAVEPGYLNDPSRFTVLRSAVTVPLASGEEVIGAMSLYSERRDAFHGAHLHLLQTIGHNLSLNLRGAAGTSVPRPMRLPDSRALHRNLAQEIERCTESGEWLSLAMCEVEGLRGVTELSGPDEASIILGELASRIRSRLDCSAYFARTGEDEIAIVLAPNTPLPISESAEEAPKELKPELMRRSFSRAPGVAAFEDLVESAAGPMNLRVRVGVAAMGPGGMEPFELVASASRSLRNYHKTPRFEVIRNQNREEAAEPESLSALHAAVGAGSGAGPVLVQPARDGLVRAS